MESDLLLAGVIYGSSVLIYAGCLVPLILLQRDFRRARISPYAASMTFLLKTLLFLLPANAVVLILLLYLGTGEAGLTLATSVTALLVITVCWDRKHRDLLRANTG